MQILTFLFCMSYVYPFVYFRSSFDCLEYPTRLEYYVNGC